MLTLEYILKISRMREQAEDKPEYYNRLPTSDQTEKVEVKLGYEVDKRTGDLSIVQY